MTYSTPLSKQEILQTVMDMFYHYNHKLKEAYQEDTPRFLLDRYEGHDIAMCELLRKLDISEKN